MTLPSNVRSKSGAVISIGSREIGGGRTFLVADVGSNHKQDVQLALDSIDAAAESGADAVKFQSLQLNQLYLNPGASIRALHKQIDLEENWHATLKAHCERRGVIFFSSPTYLGAVDLMEDLGVPLYKLASAQIGTFPQIVERVAATGKPVILSTGLVSLGEIERCVRIFIAAGNPNFVILHCNSMYPTPYEKVHLPLMRLYQDAFGCLVGYSDHTEDIYVSLAAISNGASVIEKHFILRRDFGTPDASLSLEPSEFSRLAAGARAIEKAMLPQRRIDIEPEELEFKESIRYRLILARNKECGEKFSFVDFAFLRSAGGIDCAECSHVIKNFVAKDNLPKGTLLEWELLTGA